MKKKSTAGFTLIEMLVASTVGVVVMTGVLMFLVQSLWVCRDIMAESHLMSQARLARERMLRGLGGGYGIRNGEWRNLYVSSDSSYSSINFSADDADNPWPDEEDAPKAWVTIYSDSYLKSLRGSAWSSTDGDDRALTRDLIKTETMDISRVSKRSLVGGMSTRCRILDVNLALTMSSGGRTYTNHQYISSFFIND